MRIPGPDGQPFRNERNYEEQTSLRMIWLAFAGWWLSLIWVVAGWLCLMLTPRNPTGLRMLGNMARIVAFRVPGEDCEGLVNETLWRLEHSGLPQRSLAVRLVYTVLIGWWLSLLWLVLAWGDSLSIDRRPTGVARFMRLPHIMTLRRY